MSFFSLVDVCVAARVVRVYVRIRDVVFVFPFSFCVRVRRLCFFCSLVSIVHDYVVCNCLFVCSCSCSFI